jgi:hypothetical protein
MEITCNRCHQPVDTESCYCPTCGLPQLVYTNDASAAQAQQDKLSDAVNDAGTVAWKPALRAAVLVAIPAGLLSSGVSPLGTLGLFWMSAAAAWAVLIYVRGQRAPWITMAVGARIGMVTGLLAGCVAFAASGLRLFAVRNLMGQGKIIDEFWKSVVTQVSQQSQAMNSDPQASAMVKSWLAGLQTPEARAGWIVCGMALVTAAMLAFAMIGGALSARLMARSRRPGI